MSGTSLRREDVLSFVGRDWRAAEQRKREHWVNRVRVEGALAGLQASDALREHVAAFTTGDAEARRAADLAHLIELKRRIDAASAVLAR